MNDMKHLVIAAFIGTLCLASCKKEKEERELIGTWTQIQQCYPDSNGCYVLQFTSNNKIYETNPYVVTGNYVLNDNNTIQIDDSIVSGPGSWGSKTYQISISGNKMTLVNFWTGGFYTGSPPPARSIYLIKN
jgi:hypothetical protein